MARGHPGTKPGQADGECRLENTACSSKSTSREYPCLAPHLDFVVRLHRLGRQTLLVHAWLTRLGCCQVAQLMHADVGGVLLRMGPEKQLLRLRRIRDLKWFYTRNKRCETCTFANGHTTSAVANRLRRNQQSTRSNTSNRRAHLGHRLLVRLVKVRVQHDALLLSGGAHQVVHHVLKRFLQRPPVQTNTAPSRPPSPKDTTTEVRAESNRTAQSAWLVQRGTVRRGQFGAQGYCRSSVLL